MPTPDLDATLRQASAGDEAALRELVVAHLPDIERFIRRHAKIAAHLGKSEPACRNLLVRAVSKLGVLLGTVTSTD